MNIAKRIAIEIENEHMSGTRALDVSVPCITKLPPRKGSMCVNQREAQEGMVCLSLSWCLKTSSKSDKTFVDTQNKNKKVQRAKNTKLRKLKPATTEYKTKQLRKLYRDL